MARIGALATSLPVSRAPRARWPVPRSSPASRRRRPRGTPGPPNGRHVVPGDRLGARHEDKAGIADDLTGASVERDHECVARDARPVDVPRTELLERPRLERPFARRHIGERLDRHSVDARHEVRPIGQRRDVDARWWLGHGRFQPGELEPDGLVAIGLDRSAMRSGSRCRPSGWPAFPSADPSCRPPERPPRHRGRALPTPAASRRGARAREPVALVVGRVHVDATGDRAADDASVLLGQQADTARVRSLGPADLLDRGRILGGDVDDVDIGPQVGSVVDVDPPDGPGGRGSAMGLVQRLGDLAGRVTTDPVHPPPHPDHDVGRTGADEGVARPRVPRRMRPRPRRGPGR